MFEKYFASLSSQWTYLFYHYSHFKQDCHYVTRFVYETLNPTLYGEGLVKLIFKTAS